MQNWSHANPNWPRYFYDDGDSRIIDAIRDIETSIEKWELVKGFVDNLKVLHGMENQEEIMFLSETVIKSSNIEGEYPDAADVQRTIRSVYGDKDEYKGSWEGMVNMVLDAVRRDGEMTPSRLFDWHRQMFPAGISGEGRKIPVGCWRFEPIEVREGHLTRYEAPHEDSVPDLMAEFLEEANRIPEFASPWAHVAVMHLVFEQIHPFADGNGRIGRAVCDWMLSRAGPGHAVPFHCLSSRLQAESGDYYGRLNAMGELAGNELDATEWVAWFLGALGRSIGADAVEFQCRMHEKILFMTWAQQFLTNGRKRAGVYDLVRWDALTTGNADWRARTGCSLQKATRDLGELRDAGVLVRAEGSPVAGKRVEYRLRTWDEVVAGSGAGGDANLSDGAELRRTIETTMPGRNSDKPASLWNIFNSEDPDDYA